MNEKIMYEYETEPVIQSNYKPLKKALWFTPVAFLVPTIITNTLALISDIILGVVVGIFGYYDNLALINVVLKIINVLGTSVLLIIVVLLLKMLAFRKIDPVMKKKSFAVVFLPFIGACIHAVLMIPIMISAFRVILFPAFNVWKIVINIVSTIFAALITVVLSLVTAKIFKKIEADNK